MPGQAVKPAPLHWVFSEKGVRVQIQASRSRHHTRRTASRGLEAKGRGDVRVPDITAHRGLAFSLAKRYAGRGETLDDLTQVAMLALVKAAQRFDPERGTAFSTYASATVDGELKRHFRQRWGLHVRRGDQERYLLVREIDEVLTHRLGRHPTVVELAEATGLERAQVRTAVAVAAAFGVESLSGADSESGGYDVVDEADPFERVDQLLTVRPHLQRLTEMERTILELRFGEDLPQTAIAQRLGISQMQVSRILARVLGILRAAIAE